MKKIYARVCFFIGFIFLVGSIQDEFNVKALFFGALFSYFGWWFWTKTKKDLIAGVNTKKEKTINILFTNISISDGSEENYKGSVKVFLRGINLIISYGGGLFSSKKGKELILPDNVQSYSSENVIQTGTSTAKTAAKIGLAAFAGSAATKGKGGIATLAGLASMNMGTNKTTESVVVYFQFIDQSIFTGELSNNDFQKFDKEYSIVNYEKHQSSMTNAIESWTKEIEDINEKFSAMSVGDKGDATKKIEQLNRAIKHNKIKLDELGIEAINRGIIT